MKLGLKRKKQQLQRRPLDTSNGATASSAPIVRYYRPQQQRTMSSAETRSASNTRSGSKLPRQDEGSESLSAKFKKILRSLSQWALLGAILALLVVNVTLSGTSVRTKGSEYPYRSSERYQAIVDDVLASSLTFQTKATLSSSAFEEELKKRLPEVETATAVIPLAGRRLNVLISVANPLVRLQAGPNKLAVVSASGVVTNEDSQEVINASFSELPSLSMIGVSPKVGEQILTQDEVALLKLLVSEFDGSESARPRVQSLEFDVKKREIKARFKERLYYAKLSPEEEGRLQVGSLFKTIKSLEEQGTVPSEYVDVRVEDRVFVR